MTTVIIEAIVYTIFIRLIARKETLFVRGLIPKYVAVTSLLVLIFRLIMPFEWVEVLVAGGAFFFTAYAMLGLPVWQSLGFIVFCQIFYQSWQWYWLARG